MGCCFSSETEEESTGGMRKRSSTYSLKNEKGEFKTSAHTKEFNASKWEEDTKAIWDRPLATLSCHMDLPRLGHKMKIFKNDEIIGAPDEDGEAQSKMQVVQDILITTAETCGESPELIEAIRNQYYDFVHQDGSGDISQQLKSFLEAVIPDGTKLSHILCLCHQKIVFPAYYSIKQNIFDSLPFKDSRGSWVINVFIADDVCTVVHRKTQMAKDVMAGEEPEFSFDWELVIVLTGSTYENMKESYVRIPSVDIKHDVPQQRQAEIKAVFDSAYGDRS